MMNDCKNCINMFSCKYYKKFDVCIYRYVKERTEKNWKEFIRKNKGLD